MWTRFSDMHSGGGRKTQYEDIFIEAPEGEAKIVFFNRFGLDPDNTTCDCCGADYAIYECEDLTQATGYKRGCDYDRTGRYVERKRPLCQEYVTLEDYMKREDVLFIPASHIKPHQRTYF